jgi:hypothetical protein
MSTVLPKTLGPMFKPREIKEPDMSHWYWQIELPGMFWQQWFLAID